MSKGKMLLDSVVENIKSTLNECRIAKHKKHFIIDELECLYALTNQQPQPLTELRDEIIAELEEQTLQKWKYKEYNFPLCEFKTDEVLEGFYSKGYCEITTSNGDVHWDSISLSGELAHKITTYFMRLKEENND